MVESVAQALVDRDEALRQLKHNLQRAQNAMKQRSDEHRRDVNFSIGDWVYVKLRPHRQNSATQKIYSKLAARYYGPFQIEARIGEVAYRLILPPTTRIHPVFHISQLKKAVGNLSVEAELPSELEPDAAILIEPAAVLSSREVTVQGEKSTEWLIHWQGQPIEEATWEKASNIQNQFPSFCLEDKADLADRGIDRDKNWTHGTQEALAQTRPKILKVYSRRPRKLAGEG